ncbi:MAG: hypothetical protein ACK5MA_06540 [Parachlamydiaceae bacterium]
MVKIGKNKACFIFEKGLDRYERHRKPKNVDAKVQRATNFLNSVSSSWFVSKNRLESLRLKVAAMKYRTGAQKPLEHADPELLQRLTERAQEWKTKNITYTDKELTKDDLEILAELARYPESAELILNNKRFCKNFFKWSLLNRLSVQVCVEFPHLTEKLSRSGLKMRLGTYQGKHLKVVARAHSKDVSMVMEGKPVSLLKGHRVVHFPNQVDKTVDQVFDVFRKKNQDEGMLTFFEETGVTNWDPHQQSPVNPEGDAVDLIDLDKDEWYKALPMKEHLTNEEATEKFGFECDGSQYVFTVVATRTADKLNTFGSHSFFRIAIPDGNGGYDYTHGWGKFTQRYPQSVMDLLGYLCGPKLAVLEYPDNNEQYTYRQKKEVHFPMTFEKGAACVESLRKDLRNARNNNLAFQILVHNCTDWVAKKMGKYVSEEASALFEMGFLDLEITGIMGLIVRIMRKAPQWFNNIFFFGLGIVLGGFRKVRLTKSNGQEKIISVMKTPPWKRRFQHPGVLFRNEAI